MDEALEQIVLFEAAETIEAERLSEMRERLRKKKDLEQQLGLEAPEVTVRTDDKAKALADTPHLTGDPEWDAIELAATAPDKDL